MRALVAASLATVLLASCAGASSGRLDSQALYDPTTGMTFDAAGVWSSPVGRIHLRHLDYVDDRGVIITQVGEYGERADLVCYGVAGSTPGAVYRVWDRCAQSSTAS
jgi:hypothetical protein